MDRGNYIGLDIAKNVFQLFMADDKGHAVTNRKLTRAAFLKYMANLPPCTIGINPCVERIPVPVR